MKNKLSQEQKEIELLLDKGMKFKVGKRSLHIKPLKGYTIIKLSEYQLDLEKLIEQDLNVFKEYSEGIKQLYQFIAVSILRTPLKVFFFKRLLYRYLLINLEPNKAVAIAVRIVQMYDLGNFIPSIRYLSKLRITKPKVSNPIEKDTLQ